MVAHYDSAELESDLDAFVGIGKHSLAEHQRQAVEASLGRLASFRYQFFAGSHLDAQGIVYGVVGKVKQVNLLQKHEVGLPVVLDKDLNHFVDLDFDMVGQDMADSETGVARKQVVGHMVDVAETQFEEVGHKGFVDMAEAQLDQKAVVGKRPVRIGQE